MPTGPTVPASLILEIRKLYGQRDSRGRPLWSHRSLGKHFAMSETTILRIVTATGAYMATEGLQPKNDTEMAAAAEASLLKLQGLLSQPQEEGAANEQQRGQQLRNQQHAGRDTDVTAPEAYPEQPGEPSSE